MLDFSEKELLKLYGEKLHYRMIILDFFGILGENKRRIMLDAEI